MVAFFGGRRRRGELAEGGHWTFHPDCLADPFLREEYERQRRAGGRRWQSVTGDISYTPMTRCNVCEREFWGDYARNTCGRPCRNHATAAKRKAQRQAARSKVCTVCGTAFEARAGALTCGPRCRQRQHRARTS